MTGLPESTLRYYESIGVLNRVSRDTSSGHRRYTDGDIDLAISVACLSATGLSIPKMREYLANRRAGAAAADEQIDLLEQQRRRLVAEAQALQLRQQYLAVKVEFWRAVRDSDQTKASALSKQAGVLAAQLREQHARTDKQEAA